METLKGKVVLITGASSGIGEATARRLARDGAKVVLAARRMDRLEKLQSKIAAAGGEALVLELDVLKRDEVRSVVGQALSTFGRIDALVNNAGIMPLSYMKNLHVEEWERTLDVNVKGVLYGIAAVLPLFREQRRGHIVNVSSVAARRVYPGGAVYCASKHAVRAISEGLRMELDPEEGIRVTLIEPGAVKTELTNTITDKEVLKGVEKHKMTFLEPEDVAETVAFALCQPTRVNLEELIVMPREQTH